VNDPKSALRLAEGVQNGAYALQSQLGGLDFVAKLIEEADGLGIREHLVSLWRMAASEQLIVAINIFDLC
jgi:hypothetical protein